MEERISLKGINNYGNTIDTCDTNINKQDTKLGTCSVNTCGTAVPSNNELQATLTSENGQHFKRNKYAYLVVIFAVLICIASIICAGIVLLVGKPKSIPPTQCVDSTVLRIKAKEKITARHNNTRADIMLIQPVGCLPIPQGKCRGVLPYVTTFIPNNHVDSFKAAENYLEDISDFLDCDTHALYVVCSWLYPPCITDTLQAVPCKAICEGVVNNCQEILNSTAIGSQISCEYSPAGEINEMVCQSCSYNVYLNVGEVFQFTSPNYPLAFFPNTYCVWLITSPPSTRIKFNITNVNLDNGNLNIALGQNPYNPTVSRTFTHTVTDDIEFFTYFLASVIFKSPNKVNGKKGFTAIAKAIDIKDALYCDTHSAPKSLNEDELCDGQENCEDAEDEYMCRTKCGYHVLLVNENSVELVSSTNHSSAFEQCIYTFTCPTRTRLRMEFLSLKGAVSGCNFKIGTGTNPFNTTSERTTLPRISTGIDFPENNAWIWFAQTSEKSSFVVRLSSFIESKVINIPANESYTINMNSRSINSWLEYGCLVFKSSPGYHFKLTFLNEILDLKLNKIAFGLGSDPLKYNVFILESDDYDDILELYTDTIWLKMDGNGQYAIGIIIATILTMEDNRKHILVDDVATLTYSSSEIDEVQEGSNVTTKLWIVTSLRQPNIAVKFIHFSYGTSDFNFITIGHGLDPELSSSILYQGLAVDFKRTLPSDFIIHYLTFWVRHTSYRRINDTSFALELRGIPNTDNLLCPTKFDVTEEDTCDDEFDCPDLKDEMDCADSGFSCGQRPLHMGIRTKRIIGGSEPLPGSWPWQGLIFKYNEMHCGCTLINDLWATSAAHCFSLDSGALADISVMFGSNTNQNFSTNHLIIPVSLVYFPPGYVTGDIVDRNDFVLMKLSTPVPFTNYIRPACISKSYNQFTEHDVCYATGFGVQGNMTPNTKHIMTPKPIVAIHEIPVNLLSNEKCKELQGSLFSIKDYHICAGRVEGGIGVCYGDSGGPLVCLGEDEKWYLVGITSFGHTCAGRFRPAVYYRIFPCLDFIDNIVNADLEV